MSKQKVAKRKPERRGFYKFLCILLGRIVRTTFRVRCTGVENLPEKGGFILCANHIGYPDPVILIAALPRQLRFMAKEEIFRVPGLAALARGIGVVPVKRNTADLGAMRKIVATCQAGDGTAVFPQGHRYSGQDPTKTPVKHGIGMMAYMSEVPIIPVSITMKGMKYALFRRTTIRLGKPMYYRDICGEEKGKAYYEKATQAFFEEVCRLGGFLPPLIQSEAQEQKEPQA